MIERLYKISHGEVVPVFEATGVLVGLSGDDIIQLRLKESMEIARVDKVLRSNVGEYTLINMGREVANKTFVTQMGKLEVKKILPKAIPVETDKFEMHLR